MGVEARFNETIHAPNRLRVCGLLRSVASADFAIIRETLELTDVSLSKTLRTLVEVGYVKTVKVASPARTDARRTTSVSLTPLGQDTFDAHLSALRNLAEPNRAASPPHGLADG